MKSERKDYELHVHTDTGNSYISGQPLMEGMRSFKRCVDVFKDDARIENLSYMLRLFGPHGDKQWGFITSYIIHPDGTTVERNDVTIPEPFFSGKKPEPDVDPVSNLSVEQLRSIVESVRDLAYRGYDDTLDADKELDSDFIDAVCATLAASGLRPVDK